MIDIESLLDQHVKIIKRLEQLFEKLDETEEVEEIEKEIIHLLWRLSIIRRKIRKLFIQKETYTDDTLTLLEYYSLIGLSEEEDILQKVLEYGSKGYKLLSSRREEFQENLEELKRLKDRIEELLTS
ncbi:MAG: hypothetical protein DRO40_13670 [Thermoprotei archaeon]|nr:MAG: hypothetical protein DRO40_13670 [Thermoprotei archaeon]